MLKKGRGEERRGEDEEEEERVTQRDEGRVTLFVGCMEH